jgi:predicted Zn-dependent protease
MSLSTTLPLAQAEGLARRLRHNALTRRDTMWLFAAAAAAPALQGCATSPVTGQRILVGMSEGMERDVDRAQSPHQFSADLGAVQDGGVNAYVGEVGQRLQGSVQRPGMPYSYRVLNANYANAYTFPAGAMGVTRGIMVQMGDEAELAALLGHELGHVNARHAAQRQGQALLVAVAAAGLEAASSDSDWAPLIGLGAQIGSSALLANYSRDNEREADALGQQYLVRAGYPATGMVRLHQLLIGERERRPSVLETMFSSHPMSTERRDTARRLAETVYADSAKAPAQRERYMDRTAGLRHLKPTIEACQAGETAMSKKRLPEAERQFAQALALTPGDYPALLRMGQCLQAQGRLADARRLVQRAREAYPGEAQAVKLGASLKLGMRDPAGALSDLQAYERLLPGDPGTGFLQGIALEGMGRREAAAQQFARYLQSVPQGQAAGYAMSRLQAWGYVKNPAPPPQPTQPR